MAIIHMSYGSTKLESGLMMKHVTPYAKFFYQGLYQYCAILAPMSLTLRFCVVQVRDKLRHRV